MNEEIAQRMRGWQESNLRGAQQINPGDFGLDPEALRNQFRFYTDRFSAFI